MSQRYLGGIITANPTAPTMSSASGVWTLEQQLQYSQTITPKVIPRSVRLRSSASAYFNRTPASAGNRKTWTWSGWVKRGALGSNSALFGNYFATNDFSQFYISFNTSNQLQVGLYSTIELVTTAVYRDTSAWYHVVCLFDTTQATASNRLRLFVNGVEVTSFATDNRSGLTQNTDFAINAAQATYLGYNNVSGYYLDGYLAEINFVDGQALTPSSFGAYDSNGVWQPITYTGTYGANGFYLNFSDTTSTTTLGYDTSGNSNNWTTNNISLTSGVTYDSMIDSPTNFDNGGTGVGNYAVMNPLDTYPSSHTTADGNLKVNYLSATWRSIHGSMAVTTGKWYWEMTITANANGGLSFGVANENQSVSSGPYTTGGYTYDAVSGQVYANGTLVTTLGTSTVNDVFGFALDADAKTFTIYKTNSSLYAFTGLAGSQFYASTGASTSTTTNTQYNFGQRPFSYTPPTGFKALNTQNLALAAPPTITNGAKYMAATLYTGNGATQSIANSANNTIGTTFQPDLVWIKNRGAIASHSLLDVIRGTNSYLYSDLTNAQGSGESFSAFNANGFSLSGTNARQNANANTYVGWQWKASGTTSSNTNGSITSTVSVNTTAGFSVVTYTANAADPITVGHGLGVAPSMFFVKSRSAAGTDWFFYHSSLGATKNLRLNTTAAAATATNVWNNTAPTSTVITTSNAINTNTQTYVAYCFAAVAGYSAFGSYTGNGSADGPFVYCGFRPRYVLIKRTDSTGNWNDFDTSRNTYNGMNNLLVLNSSAAEVAGGVVLDSVSNGFKLRETSANWNASGGTYIYMAFAENPFTISRAR